MFFYMMLLETPEEKRLFEEIYENYADMMYHAAYSILGNVHASEDAVHIVFVRLIDHMDTLESFNEEQRKSYLLTAVKHSAYDILRKRTRQREVSLEDVPEECLSACDQYEEGKDVLESILKLPVIYREVLQYKYALQRSDKEIAAMFGISEATVRKRIERGKKLLGNMLEGKGGKSDVS